MMITCDTKDTLPLSALTEFQGGLKRRTTDDTAKIEKSIRDYGFATPFFVWRHEGKNLKGDSREANADLGEFRADNCLLPEMLK